MKKNKQGWWMRSGGAAGTAGLMAAFVVARGASPPLKQPYSNWTSYGGAADTAQYSALRQINKSNVNKLESAWFLPINGAAGRNGFNPLIVDGVMYLLGTQNSILAIDAATGRQIWSHTAEGPPNDRGVSYWETKDRSDRRLIFAANSYLQEVNARTGVTINTFGDDGRINLREGLNRDAKTIPAVATGSPGRVFENLIILGTAPSEAYGAPPGYLRAYDVLTGKVVWTFHTVPHPGEFGYDTWPPDAWKYVGGANAWGEISIDEKRGIAYFPLGSPTMDFYGGDRHGANLFGDCILALDARTGKRIWHYQIIHHDLWDYDPTAAPKLLTVKHDGKMVDIVALPAKDGFLYVLNRVTGEPLWPIEERPVPKSDVPGEESWPTQPFPTKPPPFARQRLTVDDINPLLDDSDKARIREILLNTDTTGLFTPPHLNKNTMQIPGDDGGANWGNGAIDPETGWMYVRSGDGGQIKRITDRPGRGGGGFVGGTPEQQGNVLYMQNCESCHGPDRTTVGKPAEIGIARFKNTIINGNGGEMPPFPNLTQQDMDNLAAFITNPAVGALPEGRGGRGAQAGRGRQGQAGGRGNPEGSLSGGSNGVDRLVYPPGQIRYYGSYGGLITTSNGLPSSRPPWMTLTAYDLNQGTMKWQIPLGTVPFLAAKGITNTGQIKVGSANKDSPSVTAGGLIFIGSWADRMVHAFDKETGKVLWEKEIDANPSGIPAVFDVGGREYIAFGATGAALGGGRGGIEGQTFKAAKPDAAGYYVFALPTGKK